MNLAKFDYKIKVLASSFMSFLFTSLTHLICKSNKFSVNSGYFVSSDAETVIWEIARLTYMFTSLAN